MTQDEVDKIYEYLHENYEYRDGELIGISGVKSRKKKNTLGWFMQHANGLAYMATEVVVNKKRISKPLSHFIFIYHHKKVPKFIKHIDGNSMNCKIDNLTEANAACSKKLFEHKNKRPKGFSITRNKKFQVRYKYENKYHTIGVYDDEKIALLSYLYFEKLIEIEKEDFLKSIGLVQEKYPVPMRNKHGYKGIYKVKDKYIAKFSKRTFGSYDTPQEAHESYLKAKAELSKNA